MAYRTVQPLDWELLPYDFDRSFRISVCNLKLLRYNAVLDYDVKHGTLTNHQRALLKTLISLWTEVLEESQRKEV